MQFQILCGTQRPSGHWGPYKNRYKHKKVVSASSYLNIKSFFKDKVVSTDSNLQCAAKEATFAYHTAQHDLSFKMSDSTSKLVQKLFESKFSAARTKTEAIIVNVISLMFLILCWKA